ncbi:hypothetical protein [Effusibacillus dendaii]|uniref:Uncharacterized protein n=1 Tax=Effusibacillus dendaii TaxID=2743772 RepID=A0A7I8DE62_9BACL|nr:hypothetical protein [Effusibacillus dendaii]BCJ86181.1 hypothetical protein skT53_11660 [Effusibacillus dendaii]
MQPLFKFPKAGHYAFFYETAHLMLISWERDDKKELYRISGQQGETISLDFPGELYTDRVMDMISRIFFINVQEASEEKRYTLGAYFTRHSHAYAVYYERDAAAGELIFFRVIDEGTGYGLDVVEDPAEYQAVAAEIEERYGGFLQFH